MLLYHGGNVIVQNSAFAPQKKELDFGCGFYLTSDYSQAMRWAKTKTARCKSGNASISTYKFNEEYARTLKVLTFAEPNRKWLRYVTAKRKNLPHKDPWDIVIGPVANDRTAVAIGLYFRGIIDTTSTIRMLLAYNFKDQYCMKTDAALQTLTFVEGTSI